jgi:hypothetical protein
MRTKSAKPTATPAETIRRKEGEPIIKCIDPVMNPGKIWTAIREFEGPLKLAQMLAR